MARRKRNKSEAIRTVLAENPDAKPKEIATLLKARKVRVSTALISRVKYGASNGKRRGHKADSVSLDNLLAAKVLVARVGSIEAAKSALASFCKLVE